MDGGQRAGPGIGGMMGHGSDGGSMRVSSGDQTWLAGKWTIEIGDFPIETSIPRGFSSAIFDYQRVASNHPIWIVNFKKIVHCKALKFGPFRIIEIHKRGSPQ